MDVIACVREHIVDVDTIAGILEKDPALAGKLLKQANSALYGQQRVYRTVHDAVILLGARNSLTIALSLTLVSTFEARHGSNIDYLLVWRRSLLAAVYADAIAKHVGYVHTDEALLAALLQDIGMPALDRLEPALYPPIRGASDYHEAARDVESRVLAVDHAAVGWWLLDSWNLPDTITNAVERSHYPFSTEIQSPFTTLDKCVVLSGLMADVWLNDDWSRYLARALIFANTWMKIDDHQFKLILGIQGPKLAEFEALFSMELLNPRKTDVILSRPLKKVRG